MLSSRTSRGRGNAPAEDAGPPPPSVEELETKISTVEDSLKKEQQQRNYAQLERDKVWAQLEILRGEYAEARAEIRHKEREGEEIEERHAVEIKVYKQKVKHLLYEHQNNLTQLKAGNETVLRVQDDAHRAKEAELKQDKRVLKLELRQIELQHEDILRNLRDEHSKNVTKLREEFHRQARELQHKYEKKMALLREELEGRRKAEIMEVEERKNGHIQSLMAKHQKSFTDIKNYYYDITLTNLELIKSLKEQVEDLKKKDAAQEKHMAEVMAENRRLNEPLIAARREVDSLKGELSNYEKDKMSLANTKSRLKALEEEHAQLAWEHEVLQQRHTGVEKDRDQLYDKFVATVYDVQQKSGFRNLILEKKLSAIRGHLEKKETQLSEVLAAANLDPTALDHVTRQLDDVLDEKNKFISDLQYELARVTKAHNDAIRVYEAKLTEFGIPVECLGYRPLLSQTTAAPAGLVGK